MQYIYDVVSLVIVVICVSIAFKKGFASSLVSFCGKVIALIAAYLISNPIATALYQKMFHSGLVDTITTTIKDASGVSEVMDALAKGFDGLSMPFSNFFASRLGGAADVVSSNIDAGSSVLAEKIAVNVCQPVMVGVIQVVLVILLYIVLAAIIGAVANGLGVINKIPLLGGVNQILGAAFGLLNAFIWIYVLACFVGLFVGLTNGNIEFLNRQTIDQTILFRYAYHFSPFQ